MSDFSRKSAEEQIVDAVNKDESDIKNFHRNHLEYLCKIYKNKRGRKRTDIHDDDFSIGIGDEDESEGQVLDFIWEAIVNTRKMKTNAMSIVEKALLCKKKAEELNILHLWKKPINTDFCTGYISDIDNPDIDELFPNGKVTFQLANDYEDYLYFHKKSDPMLQEFKKWMGKNDKIQQYLKDYGYSQYELSKDKWYEYIALYYFEKWMKKIDDFTIFYPCNGESPILSFGYHIIDSEGINKKIDELIRIKDEKDKELVKIKEESEITSKLLKKILKGKEVDNLTIHNFIIILAKYFSEHSRSLKKDYVFHPKKPQSDIEDGDMDVYTIKYDDIIKIQSHLENVENKHNFELIEKIKNWAEKENIIKEDQKLTDYDIISIIQKYYEKCEKCDIPKDIIFYYPKKKESLYSLNYRIIDYEDLTDTTAFALLCYDYIDTDDESDDDDDDDDGDGELTNNESVFI